MRFAKQKRPYYCEVEYLESSGTQYIDTGINYAGTSDVITLGIAPMQATGDAVFIGAYTISPSSFVELGAYNGRYRGNIQPPADIPASMTYTVGVRNTLKFTSNGWWEFNGQQCGVTKTDPVGVPFYLFGRNYESSPKYSSARIYNVDIVRSGVKILDMIPVLDWNMTPCMYDKVSNKLFYNQGTGSFTVGRQIHYVDYLESTGTQYIDTGIIPTVTTKTAEKGRILTGGGKVTAFARWSGSPTYDTFGTYLSGSSILVYYGRYEDGKARSLSYTIGNDYELVNDIDKIIFNGNPSVTTRENVGWTNTDYTLYLFAGNNMGTASFFSDMRMYYYEVWEDGVPVRDCLPAVDENGVGFMFDKVDHKIYDNVGTGTFKYPDVPLEYLESSGTEYIQLNNTFNDTDECGGSFAMLENVADKYFIAPSTWSGDCRFALGGSHISNFSEFQPVFTCAFGTTTTGYTHYLPQTLVDYNEHKYSYKNRVFRIEDLDISFDATSLTFNGPTTNLRLFYGYNTPTKSRVYSYWQKRNGVYLCNLVPVLSQSRGGCLYDSVSETYFTNAGTGTFNFKIKEKQNTVYLIKDSSTKKTRLIEE